MRWSALLLAFVFALLYPAPVYAERSETSGACSPVITGNSAAVTVVITGDCSSDDPTAWSSLRDMKLSPEILAQLSVNSPNPRQPRFEKRFSLPLVCITYIEFQAVLREIQTGLLRIGGVGSAQQSHEELKIGQNTGAGGRVSVFNLTAATLQHLLTTPSRGFTYSFETPSGGIRSVLIDYQNGGNTKVGEETGRWLFVAADDSEKLEEAAEWIIKVFSKFGGLKYWIVDMLRSNIAYNILVAPLFILLFQVMTVLGVVFEAKDRSLRLICLSVNGFQVAVFFGLVALINGFPALVPSMGWWFLGIVGMLMLYLLASFASFFVVIGSIISLSGSISE
jgi:hypothetical protein